MTRIKLCGLSREEDIRTANELMPDYVGFVFWEKSRRYVEPVRAEKLRKILAEGISAVGVFVDEKPENISALANSGVIDIVQLHGQESEEYIACLRKLIHAPIIKAFRFGEVRETTADYVMIDSGMGTGKTFDWSGISTTRPYFLAGGLTPENVRTAIRTLHPFAVDVSSGIETDGVKDAEKIRAFVEAVREEDKE
ncbi:MAG: phosphoribosylanthranilate isomerase [Synergistaceae bacterium]|nr:phosphoribosylanthranilate isomerase [Synergistaceae bacterium]